MQQKILSPAVFLSFILVSMLACVLVLFVSGRNLPAQEKVAVVNEKGDFVEEIAPYAQELQATYGIFPSIILGQAILESNWGTSQLATDYYNLFGIKASAGEEMVHLTTQEYVNDVWIEVTGNFRVYKSWRDSMTDHTLLFVNGVSWNKELYHSVLTAADYQSAAKALQTAGYATDPEYAAKIISVIEENNLMQYDK